MAIIRTFNGASLRIPGAYSSIKVKQTGGLPLAETGIVGIVGEAAKGEPGSSAGIREFDSSTLSDLIDQYGTGTIVDAARALVNASNDPRIANGASRILVYKTNPSTQATLDLASGWGTLTSINYGVDENLINATIEEDTSETWSIEFETDFVTTPGNDLKLRVNGGSEVTITGSVCTSAADCVTELNTKLNTELGTSSIAYASTVGSRISIDLALTGTGAKRDGMGISLEFVTDAEWADVGVSSDQQGKAIVVGSDATSLSATNQTRSIIVNRQVDDITEDSDDSSGEVGGIVYLNVGCNAATSCTLTITATLLTLDATGAGAGDLSLTLADFATLNDLASFIDSQTGYTASVPSNVNGALAPTVLDRVSGVGVNATASGITPGQVKADAFEFQTFFDLNSQLVGSDRTSFLGLPDTLSKTFLTGAVRGPSTSSDFQDGFTAFEAIRINTIIPLVSQDASDDLSENADYTDSSSSYDAESVTIQAREHCKKMSNTQNRSERNAYVGFRGTFTECKNQAKTLSTEFVSLCMQDTQQINVDGELEFQQPHITACLVAGLQSGSEVGEPATFKFAQSNGLDHLKKGGVTPLSTELFNSNRLGNKNQAIDSGILILEQPSTGGVRVVLQNTTYQKDASFVFNRVHVLEAAHNVAFNLRNHLEDTFTGEKARTGTAESVRNFVISEMAQFLLEDIIVGDDTNDDLGFKNLAIVLDGNTVFIDITITPVQGIDFILARIVLDNIRQTA